MAGGGPPGAGSFDSGCVRSDYDALVFHISRLPVPTPQPQPQPAVRENKPVNKGKLVTCNIHMYISLSPSLPPSPSPPLSIIRPTVYSNHR